MKILPDVGDGDVRLSQHGLIQLLVSAENRMNERQLLFTALWRRNPEDSPEGDRLQNGPDQMALGGRRFEAHQGSARFGIIQRSLRGNKDTHVSLMRSACWCSVISAKTHAETL